ncbi:MAG TPA: hypothetical protein VFM58_12885 [Solirubrobacteraceae bacterium]|jgi:hypothetical protein|nr:hypothetical protein [Solirubrobacteraceae bacterium]
MKRTSLVVIATAIALAAGAPLAHASGFTLALAAPPAVVDHPIIVNATGTIPVDEIGFPYWFSLDAIPTTLTTTCPADRWEAAQFANGGGGAVIVLSQRETPDAAGAFTIPVAVTPIAAGTVLLCGYTDDGLTTTLARASLLLHIKPAAAPPSPPAELRGAIRGCHALLGRAGARRCVRSAVKRARAGCRRYPSHRREARCLRKVRNLARSAR